MPGEHEKWEADQRELRRNREFDEPRPADLATRSALTDTQEQLVVAIDGGRAAKRELDERIEELDRVLGMVRDAGNQHAVDIGHLRSEIDALEDDLRQRVELLNRKFDSLEGEVQGIQNARVSRERVDQLEEHIRRHGEDLKSHSSALQRFNQYILSPGFWEEWVRVRDAVAALPAPRLYSEKETEKWEPRDTLVKNLRAIGIGNGLGPWERERILKAAEMLERRDG